MQGDPNSSFAELDDAIHISRALARDLIVKVTEQIRYTPCARIFKVTSPSASIYSPVEIDGVPLAEVKVAFISIMLYELSRLSSLVS